MFILEAAIYRAYDDFKTLLLGEKKEILNAIGYAIASQLEEALHDIDRGDIRANIVTTTMLDMPFSSGWISWTELCSSMRQYTSSCPESMISAYECSSWGFALRYAKSLSYRLGYDLPSLVVISIVDINILNLSYWQENHNWGSSGFGIATVVIRCMNDSDNVSCSIAKTPNGFGEFCMDVRNRLLDNSKLIATLPFFPTNISALYDRLFRKDQVLPNNVDVWSHSFGSDPWISLIENRLGNVHWQKYNYLATSVSLNGYWCSSELKIGNGGNFQLFYRSPLTNI